LHDAIVSYPFLIFKISTVENYPIKSSYDI